jgi:RES domain-containing protein
MFVYRVTNVKYKDKTLSGIGAEKVGGRWNTTGTRAIYCSENISLALLEYYVHSEDRSTLPKDILVAKIEFPDEFDIEVIKELPERWDQYPYSSKTTSIFTNMSLDRDFFAIKVPSTIVGVEYNYVLNPLYKKFGGVEIVEFIDLPLDERLRD